jgi:hypothetical protein
MARRTRIKSADRNREPTVGPDNCIAHHHHAKFVQCRCYTSEVQTFRSQSPTLTAWLQNQDSLGESSLVRSLEATLMEVFQSKCSSDSDPTSSHTLLGVKMDHPVQMGRTAVLRGECFYTFTHHCHLHPRQAHRLKTNNNNAIPNAAQKNPTRASAPTTSISCPLIGRQINVARLAMKYEVP